MSPSNEALGKRRDVAFKPADFRGIIHAVEKDSHTAGLLPPFARNSSTSAAMRSAAFPSP
jgi:hypothetical protein